MSSADVSPAVKAFVTAALEASVLHLIHNTDSLSDIQTSEAPGLAKRICRLLEDTLDEIEPPYHFIIGNDGQLARVLVALGHTVECHG
ncbi:MAG: hypothetical protein V3W41_14610 [Planctomycetota bacterium]